MTAAPLAVPGNPYVGPRTFSRDQSHLFFGREQEARDLLARVASERLLLFYAQSGAGKSSLINARLIPGLQAEGFAVLPVGRVGGARPDAMSGAESVYLANLMLSLDQGATQAGRAGELAGLTLSTFLAGLATEDGEQWEYAPQATDDPLTPDSPSEDPAPPQRFVLIIDQFEEIITAHPDRWPEREVFFRQLDQTLREDPHLWVVLTLREDNVAALDPYAHLMTDRLRARFYMERMGRAAALEAVREPAALGGRPFAPGVVERLVDDLRQVYTPGQSGVMLGQYVEPVQLQIVCYRMWERLRDRPPGPITADDLSGAGSVTQALMDFYEEALPPVMAATGLSEGALRRWVDGTLLTTAGTRSLVHRGPQDTAGLPNAGADLLNRSFLIHPVIRGSDTWYELWHDRLIEPIHESNRTWLAANASPLSDAATAWAASGKPPGRLLEGRALEEAQAYAQAHPGDLTADETAFLSASLDAYRAARRRRVTAIVGVVAAVLLGLLAVWGLRGRSEARLQREVARSRALASDAVGNLQVDPELSILLSLAALDETRTQEAEQALRTSLLSLRLERTLLGHDGPVYDVAFSPNEQLVASGGRDGTVRLWDPDTGAEIRSITGHAEPVWGVAFSPDGSRLASASYDDTARVWDVASGEELLRLEGHTSDVLDVAFRPDGACIATGSADGTVRLWDAVTGQPLGSLGPEPNPVWAVAFSTDGLLAAGIGPRTPGLAEGAAEVWQPLDDPTDPCTYDKPWPFFQSDTVESVAFFDYLERHSVGTPDEYQAQQHLLATGSWDETARVRDPSSFVEMLVLRGHTNWVRGVTFSADGKRIATASWDQRAKVWDAASGQELFTLAGHKGWLKGVAFSPDGKRLATVSEDGTVKLWSTGPNAELLTVDAHPDAKIAAVAFSPDETLIATGGSDNMVRLWDAETGEQRYNWIYPAQVRAVAFSPDGSTLAAAGDDRVVHLNTVDGSALKLELAHRVPVLALAFSPDGRTLATGASDSQVRLWDAGTGELLMTLEGHSGFINSLAFSPDGKLLASGGGDHTARLWDPITGAEIHVLQGHADEVYDVAFSPDGQRLATASVDRTVKLWDTVTGRETGVLAGHSDRVQGVAFSPDGQRIATAGWDGVTRLWDAQSGTVQTVLGGHTNKVRDVAFGRSGRILATVGDDGTLRLYLPNLDDLIAHAQGRLQRGWTEEECQTFLKGMPCPTAAPR